MAGRLPKVTEYIKNVGKSVGYATIETVTEPTENVRDFVESNNELFKTIYSATKNYRQTMTLIDRSIKKSKIYEAANLGMKALGEDLRTGKFYNKEREDQYGMSGLMGDEFADFSEFESDNFGDWDDEDGGDEESSSVKATAASTSKLSSVINGASEAQSEVIVASAQALAGVNQASTKLLYTQSAKIHSSVMAGFSGVNAGLNTVNAILSGPLNNYMNESTKFYSDMSSKIAETNAYLKELTEMQRNLYKVQQQEYKRSKYDEITTASGTPELTAYAKNIYKNILALDPTGGMLQGDGDNNMFKMFAGSPLKAIPMMIAKMIVPSTVQATMKAFDENIGGMFGTFIARMNAWAESDAIDKINIKGIIGNLLGIKIDNKSSVDTSKYQRGPMPFDGETKKAIVDVIPQYLARIESAISGRPAQYYDGRSGRFKTMREIHKEYKQNQEGAWASSISSLDDSFKKWSESYASTQKELEDLKLAYKKLGKEVYESGGDFTPYKGIGAKGERDIEDNPYFQYFGEEQWKSFAKYLKNHDKKGVYNVANNTFSARSSRARYLTEAEGAFANPVNYLFNDSLLDLDSHGKLTRFNANGGGVGSYYTKSDKFKSATDYLKDILAEVRYMRMHGVKGGGGGNNSGPKTSFKDFYDANFKNDETIEDPWIDHNRTRTHTQTEAAKEKSLAERMGITKENLLEEFDSAQGLVDKWSVMKKGVDQLLHKPAYWIASTIEKADKRIYDVFFGDENGETFSDKHGIKYRGFLDYMVNRTSELFDDLTDKLKKGFQTIWDRFKKTKIGGWIDEHGRRFASDVGGRLKDKFQFAKNRASQAWNNTYGSLIARMRRGEVVSAEEFEAARRAQPETYSDEYFGDSYSQIFGPQRTQEDEVMDMFEQQRQMAYGGLVTKYGLTMLSPGEIVIPNPTGRGRDLANEKKEKSRIMRAIKGGKISHNAYGTDNKEENKTWGAIKRVMGEVSGNGADVAADALIGTGVSLVTGMIGGPLLGAAAGAGIGIVKNSETAKKFLFGEVDENGGRKGNVVPKSVIDFFNKNSKGMIDFGIAGAIAGLFTPLGLVGGALAGSTLGWAKNTSAFQEFMFGSVEKGTNGVMSSETRDKIKKALPKMGIGAAAGVLLGPFGLVGNAMMGAAAGYVASSDKFREILLGTEGKDGKRHGGIAGAAKAGLIDPMAEILFGKKDADGKRVGGLIGEAKDWLKDTIVNNTKKVLDASGQLLRNTFLSLGDRISDALSGVFKKHIGMPVEEFLREKIFKKVSNLAGGLLKITAGAAKTVIGAPFKAAGYLSDSIMLAQMGRGTLDMKNAQERLDLREKNKVRAGKMALLGTDKTYALDKTLASMNSEQLEKFNANIKAFMKNRGQKNVAYHDLLEKSGSKMSDYMSANGMWDNNNGYNLKKKIMNLLQEGKLDDGEIQKLQKKYKLTDEQMEGLLSSIDRNAITDARQAAIDESGLDSEAMTQLAKATGFANLNKGGTNTMLKRMLRYGKTELKFRNRLGQKDNPTEGEEKAAEEDAPIVRKANRIIDILQSINKNIVMSNGGVGEIIDDATGKTTSVEEDEDSLEYQEKQKEEEEEKEVQRGILSNLSMMATGFKDFFGFKNNPEKEERKGLISKILGFLGDNKSALGKVALTIGGVSLLGYGSEFIKNQIWPAFQKTSLYEKLDSLLTSAKDGSLFVKIGEKVGEAFKWTLQNVAAPAAQWFGKVLTDYLPKLAGGVAQGLTFAGKNLVAPLAKGIVMSLPSIAWGLVKGVVAGVGALLIPGKKNKNKSTDIEAGSEMDKVIESLPTGSMEAQIAADFSGSNAYMSGTATAGGNFSDVESISSDGTTSTTGSDFDAVGNIYRDDTTAGSRGVTNAFLRGLATGKAPALATAIGKVGSKLFSGKSIAKSATNILTGGSNPLGVVNRLGSMVNTSIKTGGRIVTGVTSAAGKVGSTLNNILSGGTTLGAEIGKVGSAIKNGVTGAIDTASKTKIGSKLSSLFGKVSGSTVADAATDVVETALNTTDNIAAAASTSSGMLSKIVSAASKFFEWLGGTKFASTIFKFLGGATTKLEKTGLKTLFKTFGDKMGKMITKGGASKLVGTAGTKVLSALGNTTPLALVLWIKSFLDGANNKTETILGITKNSSFEITTGMRFLIGLLNAVNENILLGIIDTGTILDCLIDVFGDFLGIDKDELRAAQEEADKIVEESGLDGEQKSLAEINNQQSIFGKVKNFFSKFTGKSRDYTTLDNEENVTGAGRNKKSSNSGKGRGGSQGGIYSNLAYGNSTIGESGCAPVAASMLMNGNVPEAAKFAQMTGHVAPDGSTDIGFFNDYFSAKGISNRTTTNKSDVTSALKNGQQAVLLGRDPNGGDGSAYSNNSHFITARGMDSNGNMIIDDPELGRRTMSKSKVLKNMKASVITGQARRLTGRGRETDASALANAEQICEVARSQIGTVADTNNHCIYNQEYVNITGTSNLNDPWCCKFVWWVFRHAGASELFYGGNACAGCTLTMSYYRNHNQMVSFSDAQPGDLVFFNWNHNSTTKADHIGIAIGTPENGKLTTVEGNTTKPGTSGDESNGHGVWMKTRREADIVGIARPKYKGANLGQTFGIDGSYSGYEGNEESSTTNSLFGAITDFGSKLMKGIFGEKAVDALSGSNSSSYSNSDYASSVASNADNDGQLTGSNNAEKIWTYLRSLGYTKEGTAAIMGSLYRESGLMPNNLQNSYNATIGLSDQDYTDKVNNGSYSAKRFEDDSAGYGLAQWTFSTRKKDLYNKTVAQGKSVSDLKSQLDLLDSEINSYGMNDSIRNASNIVDANEAFISKFERPAGYENKKSSLYTNRLASAREYYNQFKGTGRAGSTDKYVNEYKQPKSTTVMSGRGTVSYDTFLQTIIQTLLVISSNTDAINKILEFLSSTFGIDATTTEVKSATSQSSTDEAKKALNKLMSSRSDAQSVTNILQQKNTQWLVEAMSNIASE